MAPDAVLGSDHLRLYFDRGGCGLPAVETQGGMGIGDHDAAAGIANVQVHIIGKLLWVVEQPGRTEHPQPVAMLFGDKRIWVIRWGLVEDESPGASDGQTFWNIRKHMIDERISTIRHLLDVLDEFPCMLMAADNADPFIAVAQCTQAERSRGHFRLVTSGNRRGHFSAGDQ